MIRQTIEIEKLLEKASFLHKEIQPNEDKARQMILNSLELNEKLLKWVMGGDYEDGDLIMPFVVAVEIDVLAMMMDKKTPKSIEDEVKKFRRLDFKGE